MGNYNIKFRNGPLNILMFIKNIQKIIPWIPVIYLQE